MPKTVFTDGDKALGIPGTRVLAAFLNSIFSHIHDGADTDGHAPIIVNPLKTVSAAYSVNKDLDSEILADASAATFAVTLPSANTVTAGRKFTITKKDSSVNPVTVLPTGNDKIDGFSSIALTLPGDKAVLISDGVGNWIETGFTDGVAVIKPYATSITPYGYLSCDGSPDSRTLYSRLFGAVGTTYGVGDGATTFNRPDLRGRTILGAGQGTGLTNRTLGQTGGEESHVLITNEMPAHNHGVTDPGHVHVMNAQSPMDPVGGTHEVVMNTGANQVGSSSAQTGITIQNAGGGQGHNNMQPFIALNWMIKY